MDQWTIAMRAEKGIPSPYWGSLLHGMLMERLPDPWQDRLHENGPRPLSQWVEPGDGGAFRWHLITLDDGLSATIEPLLKSGERWPCKHLQGDFALESVELQSLTVQAYMKPFFLSETTAPRLRLSFLTTTTHKTQGEYALFPSVELIARQAVRHGAEPGAVRRRGAGADHLPHAHRPLSAAIRFLCAGRRAHPGVHRPRGSEHPGTGSADPTGERAVLLCALVRHWRQDRPRHGQLPHRTH